MELKTCKECSYFKLIDEKVGKVGIGRCTLYSNGNTLANQIDCSIDVGMIQNKIDDIRKEVQQLGFKTIEYAILDSTKTKYLLGEHTLLVDKRLTDVQIDNLIKDDILDKIDYRWRVTLKK